MSDTSGGLGWWQAGDGKWYPPERHPDAAWRDRYAADALPTPPPAPSTRPGRNRWLGPVAVIVAVALVAAGAVFVLVLAVMAIALYRGSRAAAPHREEQQPGRFAVFGGGILLPGSVMVVLMLMTIIVARQVTEGSSDNTLRIDVSGALDGDVQVGVALHGKNPRYEGGRRVELNVNVETNLPALLRGGRSVTGVPEVIERRLRDRVPPDDR